MLFQAMHLYGPRESDNRERQSRLTAAFIDAAIATPAALDAVLAAVYRPLPDRLAHVRRVAWLSVRMGRELKLSEDHGSLIDLEMTGLDAQNDVILQAAH